MPVLSVANAFCKQITGKSTFQLLTTKWSHMRAQNAINAFWEKPAWKYMFQLFTTKSSRMPVLSATDAFHKKRAWKHTFHLSTTKSSRMRVLIVADAFHKKRAWKHTFHLFTTKSSRMRVLIVANVSREKPAWKDTFHLFTESSWQEEHTWKQLSSRKTMKNALRRKGQCSAVELESSRILKQSRQYMETRVETLLSEFVDWTYTHQQNCVNHCGIIWHNHSLKVLTFSCILLGQR